MTDEKKNATLAKEQSNSALANADTAPDSEKLSEDELDAVAGGGLLSIGIDKDKNNQPYPGIRAT